MLTITGKVTNARGKGLCCQITVLLVDGPLMDGGGIITSNQKVILRSNANGDFSIDLHPGVYTVLYATVPETQFEITVVEDSGSMTIDELVSSELTFLAVAPNRVYYQGQLPGGDTFKFANGQIQLWDQTQGRWLALGATTIDNVGVLTLDVPTVAESYRFTNVGIQLWDQAAYQADNTKPWRILSCDNGQLSISEPVEE